MAYFDIKALVAKVENLVYGDSENASKNTVIDTLKEKGIFDQIVKDKDASIQKGLLTQEEANKIFGFEPSSAARRASGNGEGDGDGGNGGADTTIIINNNINITINVSVEVQQIIDGFIGTGDLNALVQELIAALNSNEQALEEFLVGMINEFADNLGLDLADINELLKQILEKLKEQGIQIANMEESITKLLKQQIELLKAMGFDLDVLVEGVGNNNEKLGEIYEAIIALTNNFNSSFGVVKEQFNEILAQLKAGNISLEQVLALLKGIKEDTSEGNKISKDILAAIQALGVELTTGLTQILEAINNGDEAAAALLEKLLAAIKENTEGDKENAKAIIEAINQLGIDMAAGFTKILEAIQNGDEAAAALLEKLLAAIKENTEGDKENAKAIIDAINKLGIDMAAGFTKILEAIQNGDEAAAALLEKLLAAIKENTEGDKENAKAIIDAINKLGIDMAAGFTKILDAIQNGDEAAAALLEKLLAAIKENTEEDKKNTQAIIDAIGKLSGDIVLAFNNLLERTDVNFEKLFAKLQEILEKIQDHDVQVTVDVEVTCTCNCGNCNNPNEGIIGELNDVFNARGFLFSDDDMTGIREISAKDVLGSKQMVYTLDGMQIDPNRMRKGNVYIINGKKILYK